MDAAHDPFHAPTAGQAQADLDDYHDFLVRRDGQVDREARTLSAREAFFDHLPACRWQGILDRDSFYRNLGRRPESGLSPEILWLLAAAKANQAERYAVELELAGDAPVTARPQDPFVLIEEVYHTRILHDVCSLFDLPFEPLPPSPFTRAFIHVITGIPDRWRLPLVMAGEVVGAGLFGLLRDTTERFEAEPEVQRTLENLIEEILLDEEGHVRYCRARLGPRGLSMARRLLPCVLHSTIAGMPEFITLAGGKAALFERIRTLRVPPVAAMLSELEVHRA